MEAFAVGDFASFCALSLVTAAELDELDAIGIGVAEPVSQRPQWMAIAGARHAVVDLGQKHHVGRLGGKRCGDGIAIAKPLNVPGHNGQGLAGLIARRRAADLDLAERGNGGCMTQMGGAVARAFAHRLAVGDGHMRQLLDQHSSLHSSPSSGAVIWQDTLAG